MEAIFYVFDGYRIVILIPAGRRALMRAGPNHLLYCPLIDQIRLLVNTSDPEDMRYLEGLKDVVVQPLRKGTAPSGIRMVNQLYPAAVDADTIYVKIDDDIVWIEDGAIETLLQGRVRYRQAFLVSPMVFNNTHCTHHLQLCCKLGALTRYVGARTAGFAWSDGDVCETLHHTLLAHIQTGTLDALAEPPNRRGTAC